MAIEDEIVRRVITKCVEPGTIECRLWRCQQANACRKHEYVARLGEIMDAIEAKSDANQ